MINDITGDALKSKAPSKEYLSNWELIWGHKKQEPEWTPEEEEAFKKITPNEN